MSHELMYTSVARGLRPGEHGFCTVAVTQGIPAALTAKLESLCGYRHLFPPSDQNARLNPVLNSHLRIQVDGKIYHILSRIADAGLDYSQRTNKFAHHLVLDRSELPPAGPAWLLAQPRVMESEWNGRDPQVLPVGRRVPSGDASARPCRHWEEVMGDAGWGGVLAAMTGQGKPAYLIFQPGTDPLPLIAESIALLPSSQRWNVTFSTYYTGLPPDINCQWRCLPAGTPEATSLLESNAGNVIVLDGDQGDPPDGPMIEAARTGRVERESPAPSRSARASSAVPVAAAALPSMSSPAHRQTANSPGPSPRVKREESATMNEYTPAPSSSRSGNLTTLALGLVLGMVLMLFCVLPIELLSGHSLPRMFGVADKQEVALKSDLDKVRTELESEKKRADDLQQRVRELQTAGAGEPRPRNPRAKPDDSSNPKPDDQPPPENIKPKENPDPTGGKPSKGDNDKPAPVPDKEPKPGDKPATPDSKEPKPPDKSEPDNNKPMKVKDRPMGSGQGMKPVGPQPETPSIKVMSPLIIRDPDSTTSSKGVPLDVPRGSTIELLGLPMKVGDGILGMEPSNSRIEVNLNNKPVGVFQLEGDQWSFAWASKAANPEFDVAREALRCCVLLSKQSNGNSAVYPISQPKPLVREIKRPGRKPEFVADLMFRDGSNDGKPARPFVLRYLTINIDGVGPVEPRDESTKWVGNILKDKSTVELTINGSLIEIVFSSERSLSGGQSVRFDLCRRFEGIDTPVKVAEVRCNYRSSE